MLTFVDAAPDGYVRCPRCGKRMEDDPKLWVSPNTMWCPNCEKLDGKKYLFSVKRYPGKTIKNYYL